MVGFNYFNFYITHHFHYQIMIHDNIKTFYNAVIITMNSNLELIEDGYITIENGKIKDIGEGKPNNQHNLINANGKIIIPGFINAHTHLPMAMYRGIADDLPLHTWLEDHIWPAEAKHTNENNVRKATRLGLAEMIKTGTTTFADMYFFVDAIADETEKAGMRAVMGEAILDFPTNSYKKTTEALSKAENLVIKLQNNELIEPAFIFHSTYTVQKDTLLKINALAKKHKVRLFTHASETQDEVKMVTKEQGKTPIEYLSDLNILETGVTAAHCVWASNSDQDILKQHNASVAHCPSSNLKLGSGIAPIPQMLKKGINVAIGTDGCASNNNLDMVEEMRLTALLHKGNNLDATVVPAQEALKMATINGAKALGLDEKIGSLEIGKQADLLIIDTKQTFMNPIYDYYSAIVYSMNSSCIESVIVNGKALMENRKLVTLDESFDIKLK